MYYYLEQNIRQGRVKDPLKKNQNLHQHPFIISKISREIKKETKSPLNIKQSILLPSSVDKLRINYLIS